MPGTFSSPLRVSDPDMHHGACVTHVPWCMPGSPALAVSFEVGRENVPGIHALPAILPIWQEAHWTIHSPWELHEAHTNYWAVPPPSIFRLGDFIKPHRNHWQMRYSYKNFDGYPCITAYQCYYVFHLGHILYYLLEIKLLLLPLLLLLLLLPPLLLLFMKEWHFSIKLL